MPSVTALRHVAFEDLGTLDDIFRERKWDVGYVEAPTVDWTTIDPLAPDLLVVLGGPISANDEKSYPFLSSEIAAIKQRLAADRPTLGICLGAQLIARAWGQGFYGAREGNRLEAFATVRRGAYFAGPSSQCRAVFHVPLARRFVRFAGRSGFTRRNRGVPSSGF